MQYTSLVTVVAYCVLMTLTHVTSRTHRPHTNSLQNHVHRQHSQNDLRSWRRAQSDSQPEDDEATSNHIRRRANRKPLRGQRSSDEVSSSSEESDYERHAYIMNTDHLKPASSDEEHHTLQEAFQRHMSPTFKVPHDIYAYKLPSDLWFIVRYKKNAEGRTDKYMNVVSSFTKYLDKMDSTTKSVSVNVNGVETVFRLTSKP